MTASLSRPITRNETSVRPGLVAVVVHFRREDLLDQCLRSLQASDVLPERIVVVENGARPSSAVRAMLQRAAEHPRMPPAALIDNRDNRGYAAACNQGWRATAGREYLFLNADVTMDPGTIGACLRALDGDPAVGIVTPRVLRPGGQLDHACHRGIPTPAAALTYSLRLHRLAPRSRRLAGYLMSWEDPLTEHDVEACSGAFMLVRRDVIAKVGGWDEGYWFYAEDLELCLRAQRLGYRVRYVGTATATHVKSASSHMGRPDAQLTSEELATKRRVRLAIAASHERFYKRHLEADTPTLLRPLVTLRFKIERRLASLAVVKGPKR